MTSVTKRRGERASTLHRPPCGERARRTKHEVQAATPTPKPCTHYNRATQAHVDTLYKTHVPYRNSEGTDPIHYVGHIRHLISPATRTLNVILTGTGKTRAVLHNSQ